MLKLFAVATLVLGCGYIGAVFSMAYKKRVQQLEELCNALRSLEFDIGFRSIPLREAFDRAGKACTGGVRDIFAYVSQCMAEERCTTMETLFRKAVERFKTELGISDDDIDILLDFSKKLGSGDSAHENKNIQITLAKLGVALEEARNAYRKNSGLCRGMGILGGVFAAIVLV